MWESILLTTAMTVAIFLRLFLSHFRHSRRRRIQRKKDIRADFWEYEDMKKMIQNYKDQAMATFKAGVLSGSDFLNTPKGEEFLHRLDSE